MKLLTIIGKIKRFSNQDLALYLLIISSFLPFYLFLTLFDFFYKFFFSFFFSAKINTSSKRPRVTPNFTNIYWI